MRARFWWALCLAPSLALAGTPSKDEARKIIENASRQSNVRALDARPFRLLARITIRDSSGNTVSGALKLVWFSNQRWREELDFPGYREVRVGGTSERWIQRSLPYEPLPMRSAKHLLFPSTVGVSPDETIRRVRSVAKPPQPTTCISVDFQKFDPRDLCFDTAGRLVRATGFGDTYEYSEYVQMGTKILPRRARLDSRHGMTLEAQVEELVLDPEPSGNLFEPPLNAERWDWCEKMKSATWLSGQMPDYDRLAFKHLDGGAFTEVTISSVIGTDGLVHDLQVLQTGGKPLDEASIEAMKQWRYKPAQCGEKPVRVELVVAFPYHHAKMTSDCPGIGLSKKDCAPPRQPKNMPVFTTPDPENPVPRSGRSDSQ